MDSIPLNGCCWKQQLWCNWRVACRNLVVDRTGNVDVSYRLIRYAHCSTCSFEHFMTSSVINKSTDAQKTVRDLLITMKGAAPKSIALFFRFMTSENRNENRFIFTSAVRFGSKLTDNVTIRKSLSVLEFLWLKMSKKRWILVRRVAWEHSEMMWNNTDGTDKPLIMPGEIDATLSLPQNRAIMSA